MIDTSTPSALTTHFDPLIARCITERLAERLWARDVTVFGQTSQAALASIHNRLGWLDAPDTFESKIEQVQTFAQEVIASGVRHVVLLGMGGSSLCVEVIRDIMGVQPGYPEMIVLDSTHPDQILQVERSIDLNATLFVLASKSGTTIESDSLFRYFWNRIEQSVTEGVGKHFVAITDPGTQLDRVSAELGFRNVFKNPADIGGRFSALSYFGLVPAALMGVDLTQFVARAREEARFSKLNDISNPSLALGATLAACNAAGMQKLLIHTSPSLRSFVYWVEQLIAESTGKAGKGLLPVEEGGVEIRSLPADVALLTIEMEGEEDLPEEEVHPAVISLQLRDPVDLAAQFFRWEFATAVTGALLEINPFDEPNVTESKENTKRVLEESTRSDSTLDVAMTDDLDVIVNRLDRQQGFIAILAYMNRTEDTMRRLQELRDRLVERTHRPITIGIGPRYLHSTGQYHKGGPLHGAFVIVLDDPKEDVEIPGKGYSFGTLLRAQAIGDMQALAARDLPVAVLRLDAI